MNNLIELKKLIADKYGSIMIDKFNGWQLVTIRGEEFTLGPDGYAKDGVTYKNQKELQTNLAEMNSIEKLRSVDTKPQKSSKAKVIKQPTKSTEIKAVKVTRLKPKIHVKLLKPKGKDNDK